MPKPRKRVAQRTLDKSYLFYELPASPFADEHARLEWLLRRYRAGLWITLQQRRPNLSETDLKRN